MDLGSFHYINCQRARAKFQLLDICATSLFSVQDRQQFIKFYRAEWNKQWKYVQNKLLLR